MNNSKPSDSLIERRGHEYGVHHIIVERASSLGESIQGFAGLSADCIQDLIALGSVYLNHNRFFGAFGQAVDVGDYVRVHGKPRRYSYDGEITSLIVFENTDFIVVNKPPGLPVHALVDNFRENLLYLLKEKLGFDLHVTSRLDIPTSGLILYAKNQQFQKKYNGYVRDGKIQKIYRAICENKNNTVLPKRLEHFMEPSEKAPKKIRREGLDGDLKCELEVLEQKNLDNGLTEFSLRLITGRTHQIRAQLSFEGYPIIGDFHYGSRFKTSARYEEIALQSCGLKFCCEFNFNLESLNWREKFAPN